MLKKADAHHGRLALRLLLCCLPLQLLSAPAYSQQTQVQITGLRASASSGKYSNDYGEAQALDGNSGTFWLLPRVATPSDPAFIEIDLGPVGTPNLTKVRRIRLLTAQSADGWTEHNIYGRGADGTWLINYGGFIGTTWDSLWLDLASTSDVAVRTILIQTTTSSGWVGWREIEVYEDTPPPPPPPSPAPSPAPDVGSIPYYPKKKVFLGNPPADLPQITYQNCDFGCSFP